jgi:hypothetical protein
MNRVVSVDKSLLSGGTVTWFVTLEDGNGSKTRIEVGEAEAGRFERMLNAQDSQGESRVLTETMPLS